MLIGVPKEVKKDEFRVAVLPDGVRAFRREGHQVWVEKGAGEGCGHDDAEYAAAGAQLVHAGEIWDKAGFVFKVKEPQPEECERLRHGQIVMCYFHFAASAALTNAVRRSGAHALALETIKDREGRLPCLVPMSEIAGRMAVQEGAKCLEKVNNGRGILLGGVPGVRPAEVLVAGGGVVGSNAARMAAGLGARVTVMDLSLPQLRHLSEVLPANVTTVFATPEALAHSLKSADLVIGAVLQEGGPTPKLFSRELIRTMKPGAALVDVSVDQGGCSETSRPTTHSAPTFVEEGVVHYCVSNMPGGVALSSTQALSNATLPYALKVAGLGLKRALLHDPGLAHGLNFSHGFVVHPAVAHWMREEPVPVELALGQEP